MPRKLLAGLSAVLLTVVGVGCGRQPPRPAGTDRIKPAYNASTGRLERITYDRNGDGKVDALAHMDGTTVVRAELDTDFDGVVDRIEYYAPLAAGSGSGTVGTSGAAPGGGVLTRVESSSRPDGKITRSEYYEGGLRTRAEEDTDGDGRLDKWETWRDGAITTIALDTQGRGRPDRRLVYGADGSGPSLEVDPDGTGQFRPAPAQAAR
jgi:hypothetical protein